MFFSSVKEINRSLKDMNRLLSRGMSNIYLKVTIEKIWHTQNFNFLSVKSSSPVSGDLQLTQISLKYQIFLFQLKNQRSGSKRVWVLYYFYFESNYDGSKSKSPCFLWNKNINFNKSKTIENGKSHTQEVMNLAFQLV